jgi:hypothetical protein
VRCKLVEIGNEIPDLTLLQGDVLSTLLFNVVLKIIVRQANLIQTTGTIYNKETQLLAYADDRDIYAARKSKMVYTGGGTNTNSIKNLTARMPQMPRRQADCAKLAT